MPMKRQTPRQRMSAEYINQSNSPHRYEEVTVGFIDAKLAGKLTATKP